MKFYQDSSATKQSFEQLLQSKVASDKPSSKHYYEEIVNNWTDTDVFGKFGKVVGDTGITLISLFSHNFYRFFDQVSIC